MYEKSIKLISSIIILSSLGLLYARGTYNVGEDHEDYVPDTATAIKIAEAIWLPIYGEKMYSERPYTAHLDKARNVWTVFGALPEGYLGGVAVIEIRKHDCRVLKVYQGK